MSITDFTPILDVGFQPAPCNRPVVSAIPRLAVKVLLQKTIFFVKMSETGLGCAFSNTSYLNCQPQSGIINAMSMTLTQFQYVSDEEGKHIGVIVPIEL
jgi:hypothetical protein